MCVCVCVCECVCACGYYSLFMLLLSPLSWDGALNLTPFMSSLPRTQALRLDKFATQLKSDMKFQKEKLDAVEEDRAWLEKQLKSSKKASKLMRAELDVRTQSQVRCAAAFD